MVSFGEKERYLGEAANAQYMRNIKNTVNSIKRLIGHKWGEKEVQEELKNLPFKTVELPNHDVGVEVLYAGEVKRFSIVAIAAMLLQKLKLTAETSLSGRQCKDVVISVPGFWTDQQRRALLNAAQIANLNCLRLVNDNTATALSYGIYKTNLSETEPIYVLFLDMGHSSTSVSVVEFLKGKLKVLSSAYARNLGGRTFDNVLVNHFVHEFKEKFKIDIKTNARALLRLEAACEKLKKILNTNPEAPINIECIMEDKDVHGMMTKENFETLARPIALQVLEPVKQALADSGITAEKLFAVEIVGGASRLAVVKTVLGEFFKRDINQTLNAEEAVAKGCALQVRRYLEC
jgi:heat shock protein 4